MAVPGRDNGLQAQAYAPLANLDPRLADAMLALLRDSGIAAYATPAGGELGGYFGRQLPNRPTDRLYVDASATQPAWQLLRGHLPSRDLPSRDREREGLGGDLSSELRDEEQAWQEIVAGYDTEPPGPVPPWPASEDLGGDEELGAGKTGKAGDTKPSRGEGSARAASSDAEDEHYMPPPPPPLPRPDPLAAIAWVALFGGPGYLLAATVLGVSIPGWTAFLAVAAFVGGFVTLVIRMGDDRPPDSGTDDGAVV